MKKKLVLALGASILALVLGLFGAVRYFRSPMSGEAIVQTEMYGTISAVRLLPDGLHAVVSDSSKDEGMAVVLDPGIDSSRIVSGMEYRISYELDLKTKKVVVTSIDPARQH